MDIEYSETKSQRNEEERGISFSNAERFEIESAIVVEDNRKANEREVARYENKA